MSEGLGSRSEGLVPGTIIARVHVPGGDLHEGPRGTTSPQQDVE